MQWVLPSRYLHIKGSTAVHFPPELYYETIFLKTLNSPVTEHREMKLNWAEFFFHMAMHQSWKVLYMLQRENHHQ